MEYIERFRIIFSGKSDIYLQGNFHAGSMCHGDKDTWLSLYTTAADLHFSPVWCLGAHCWPPTQTHTTLSSESPKELSLDVPGFDC